MGTTASTYYGWIQAHDAGTGSNAQFMGLGGNVGIGTSSPAGSLDVQGTSALFMARTSSGLAAYIENDGGYAKQYLYQVGGNVKLQFNTNGDSYFNGGNVGIGTTAVTSPVCGMMLLMIILQYLTGLRLRRFCYIYPIMQMT